MQKVEEESFSATSSFLLNLVKGDDDNNPGRTDNNMY